MAYKPGDLFIGVTDFFGILVPGATLLFLQRPLFFKLLGGRLCSDNITIWIAFLLGSYVFGHFILAFGVLLNGLVYRLFPEKSDAFYQEAKDKISLPEGEQTRADAFHRAYSFVRLESPAAAADIERQMGDYQLFRSLVLVFGLDFLLACGRAIFWTPLPASRVLFSVTLLLLASLRFPFLLRWAHRTTFEYYTLLNGSLIRSRQQQNKAPNPIGEADD